MNSCDKHILDVKNYEDIDNDVLDKIRKVTYKMETLPVGTFKYKLFKYPGDIDIFEEINSCCYLNESKIKASNIIRDIILKVMNDKSFVFTDFKAGYDKRYKIYTGILDDGVKDYDSNLIIKNLINLHGSGLLTDSEYSEFEKLVYDNPTIEQFNTLNEELRKHWVLRWSTKEIIQGHKLLRNNYKIFLEDALSDNSIVKLDTIAPISGEESRYIEITNFFLISQKDKYGNVKILSEEFGDYEQSILGDVYKYRNTKVFKAVKRLWMYLAYKRRICDLNKFKSLFNSYLGLFSQINSDIEVAIDLLSSDKMYDKIFLIETLTRRLCKLGHIMNIDPIIKRIRNTSNHEIIVNILKNLSENITEYININTNEWLRINNINIDQLIEDSNKNK